MAAVIDDTLPEVTQPDSSLPPTPIVHMDGDGNAEGDNAFQEASDLISPAGGELHCGALVPFSPDDADIELESDEEFLESSEDIDDESTQGELSNQVGTVDASHEAKVMEKMGRKLENALFGEVFTEEHWEQVVNQDFLVAPLSALPSTPEEKYDRRAFLKEDSPLVMRRSVKVSRSVRRRLQSPHPSPKLKGQGKSSTCKTLKESAGPPLSVIETDEQGKLESDRKELDSDEGKVSMSLRDITSTDCVLIKMPEDLLVPGAGPPTGGSNACPSSGPSAQECPQPSTSGDIPYTEEVAENYLPRADAALVEAAEYENYLQSTFWVRREMFTTFEQYLRAAADVVGTKNVISFDGEDRSRLEITLSSPREVDRIIKNGLIIGEKWQKAYRLSEKPVLLMLHGVPAIIPHANIARALSDFGKCRPDDCEFLFVPCEDKSLGHIKSHRRKVWLRMDKDREVPEDIQVMFAGEILTIRVTSGGSKCFNCGKFGHLKRNCRLEPKVEGNKRRVGNQRRELIPDGHRIENSISYKDKLVSNTGGNKGKGSSGVGGRAVRSGLGSLLGSHTSRGPAENAEQYVASYQSWLAQEAKTALGSDDDRGAGEDVGEDQDCVEQWRIPIDPHTRKGGYQWGSPQPLPRRDPREKSRPGKKNAKVNTDQGDSRLEEDTFQLISMLADANTAKGKMGEFPQTLLESLDVDRAQDIVLANIESISEDGRFHGIDDFIAQAANLQSMNPTYFDNSNKRVAPSSDNSSSALPEGKEGHGTKGKRGRFDKL